MTVATPATPIAVPRLGRDRSLFRARELSASTLLVCAVGEVDASNSGALFDFIEERLARYRQLVLDLSHLTFFSADGFSTLHTIDVRLAPRGIDWVLVAGPAVERLLRVCDPEAQLTTTGNIVSAVAALARRPHTLLQLAALPK